MGGFRDIIDKYTKLLKAIPEDRKTNALIMGNDALALTMIDLDQGKGADGVKFDKYSEKIFPYWLINPSDFNSSNKVRKFKKDASKKKVKGSYENLRKYAGLPTDRRTHSFNGDMLSSIFVSVVNHNFFTTTVEVKAKDEENQNKVDWNSNKVGINILSFSDQTKEVVKELNDQRIFKLKSKI